MQRKRRTMRVARVGMMLAILVFVTPLDGWAGDPFLRRTATVKVAKDVGPAVVSIMTEQTVQRSSPFRGSGDPRFDRFFRDFFEPRARRETVQNLGSGVIIDPERHVLTNAHVISGASRIQVSLSDGREFEAILVGADPNNDLAVLRIETEEKLPWVPPGTSLDLMVGEPVIAIGNPFGLSNSVTTGVISAIDRSLNVQDGRIYHGFLQTDALINPGNSGGPLLNAEGSLIGINTAIYGGAQGIGFAVPIEVAKRVVGELLEHGEIQPVWIGLEFQNLDPALQEVMQLPEGVFGALVNHVEADSPASRAKVRRGDIVLSVDGHTINNAAEFFQTLETTISDQKITLELWRSGNRTSVGVVAEQIPARVIDEYAVEFLGLELAWQEQGHFEIAKVAGGSFAESSGLASGDLLLGINGRALRDRDELRRALLELRGHHRALLVVQRSGRRYHITVPLR
jgi:serine protease Do